MDRIPPPHTAPQPPTPNRHNQPRRPTPNTPLASLDAFIRELGPAQNGYDTRGRGWNCGTYVLRILENLIEAGLVRSSLSPQELFLEGEVLGAKLERLRELRGVEGVPVVDVWR